MPTYEDVSFFATAAKGTEPAVRDELRDLRFRKVRADRGGVHFEGLILEGIRACLEVRTAVRVLWERASFPCTTADDLYEGTRGIDWSDVLTPERTLAVRAASRSEALRHTGFVAQRTKDAIVDRLREGTGSRPTVDVESPDVGVFVHIAKDQATVYVDLAGEPLHRRGYRPPNAPAPLKETLAASIVRMSGWDRRLPLLDPMCGSGTLAVEAAMWSQGVLPSAARERFGFERWANHDAERKRAMIELRERARRYAQPKGPPPRVIARDASPQAIEQTRESARRAGVTIEIERAALGATRALSEAGGFIVVNPPYGERLEADEAVYQELGRAVRRLPDHTFTVLAGSPAIVEAIERSEMDERGLRGSAGGRSPFAGNRAIPRRPSKLLVVHNGAIECRLARYDARA